MDESTKRVFDVSLTLLASAGAIVAFVKALHEWREGQRWKRSEQLDKFIEKFELSSLLRLACTVVDWTTRTVKYDGHDVVVTNRDALLALRDHSEGKGVLELEGHQPLIRDAYDCLLTFFVVSRSQSRHSWSTKAHRGPTSGIGSNASSQCERIHWI